MGALVVSIDGPAGSGKSTTARLVAERLGIRHIDTGAMYRVVALLALEEGADLDDPGALGAIARSADVRFGEGRDGQIVRVHDRDVTAEIRSPAVTGVVSKVSAHPTVRAAMVRRQRKLSTSGGVVLEGRDIGTVVLPWADVKIFLVASVAVRAERRRKDLEKIGVEKSLAEVGEEIAARDELDSRREHSPLRKPIGAWVVDTSEVTIDEQVERIESLARDTLGRRNEILVRDRRNEFARHRLNFRIAKSLIYVVMRVFFGLRVRRLTKDRFRENYIFASNHLAYADPPFVGSTLPRETHFVAKASLFENPFFGWLIRTYNAIPIKRGVFDREAMARVLELLQAGGSVVIFPEGQRVVGGGLGKAKGGVGYLACQSGVAVIPVFVRGTNELGRCLARRARLEVWQGRPIRIPRELLASCQDVESNRLFGEMVMAAISALREEALDPGR